MTRNGIALGTFDGLHKGHRAVLEKLNNCSAVAVTFCLPPKAKIQGKTELLMLPEDKLKALGKLGIKETVMLDFDKVSGLSPKAFLDEITDKYKPAIIACGYNYRFGNKAEGDTEYLEDYCFKKGIELSVAGCVYDRETPVSSTMIRTLLKTGQVEKANHLMYENFGFSGEVLHGDGRGHLLGFPTINQSYPELLVELKYGVYESEVIIDSVKYKAISNIGIRPSFKTRFATCETYIGGFSGDLYGKTVRLNPIRFIREEQKFDSVEALKTAVLADITNAKLNTCE